LHRKGLIDIWHDRDISAGTEWEREIDQHFNEAQIILLLVSPDFMASDYCYGIEMKRALERHERGEAYVIPVILRPVYWKVGGLDRLQALPTNGKPILHRDWDNEDEAFLEIVHGICKVVDLLRADELKSLGNIYFSSEYYESALEAYEQAIRLDSHDALVYYLKGFALLELERDEEALAAVELAIQLNPNNANFHFIKSKALFWLYRHDEALAAIEQAIHLNPNNALFYYRKSSSQSSLLLMTG